MGSVLALNHKFFMLPKVEARPKVCFVSFFFVWFFFGTMRLFFRKFRILSKGTPCIFWSFRFVKTFNEPEWSLFEFFGIVRLEKILGSKKNFKNNFFEKNQFLVNVSNSCSLNIFEPQIWPRLDTIPSCLF